MGTEQVNTVAAMPYRFPVNPATMYAGSVGCMDTLSEINGSYPMPMAGGMPSVFNGACGMPFTGMMPGMMGGMMGGMYGMGPGFEYMTMDTKTAMNYQNELRRQSLTQGVELTRLTQDANFQATNHNDLVSEKVAVLNGLIRENNQDQIPKAYETLKEAVRLKLVHDGGAEPTEHQIDTLAKKAYAEAMKGRTVLDDLTKHGDSAFMSGFYKYLGGIGWAFKDHKTATQNKADLEGVRVSKSEKSMETAGKVVGGILSFIGAIALWKLGKKALSPKAIPIIQEAEKALSPAEKLAKIEAHIKGLEADPRIVGIVNRNKDCCPNLSAIHEWRSNGLIDVSAEEKLLLDVHAQAVAAASELRAKSILDQHNAVMSS